MRNTGKRHRRQGLAAVRHDPIGKNLAGDATSHKHQVVMRPQISIIIPHRNTPEKLRRLLDSIPVSPQIDLIVVDDNSDAGRQADQLQMDYPHARFFPNSGPDHNAGSARNQGLGQVRSEWLLFADADDYFVDEGVCAILGAIESAGPETDVIFFNVTSWNEDEGRLGFRHQGMSMRLKQYIADGSGEIQLRYHFPVPWAKAIRLSLLSQFGIRFDSIAAGNDVMFSQLCGHHARKIACVGKTVYCVVESGQSLTSNLTSERALARLGVLVRANTNLMRWGVKTRLDWGVTWFLKSLPGGVSKHKVQIYVSYVAFCLKRALLFR